ncbi:hypothetical protein ACGFNU_38990 [Spirillospora sp. NPDC048911]|uniref:hypothetical protein n=1 Tax=Spirillospora sp. NPDC048911 TaxID=3364527 RepID=UPI0037209B2A
MDMQRKAGADALRRLRTSRGMSWAALAQALRGHAGGLRIARIAAAQTASVQRTIARWESGRSVPDEQYQLLLCHVYARTATGAAAIGPGSDFSALLDALAHLGATSARLSELRAAVTNAVTASGLGLLAFIGAPLRAGLASALADPDRVDEPVMDELATVSDAVNAQIGSVPFVRLHLAQAAVVDACRQLLVGEQPGAIRVRLQDVAGRAFALAARLAFESHDDVAALRLYEEAVQTIGSIELPTAP